MGFLHGHGEVFDRPTDRRQPGDRPTIWLAHMQLRAAYLSMQQAAWRYDRGMPCGDEANSAKYLAAEGCWFAADQAIQTHGGLGSHR